MLLFGEARSQYSATSKASNVIMLLVIENFVRWDAFLSSPLCDREGRIRSFVDDHGIFARRQLVGS